MNQVTVMFKKDDVAEVGGYIDWYCEEDYYLWIRLAIAGKKFGNVNENLVNVRVGDEMYQRRGGWKYFKSEAKLQKYMLSNGMINSLRYLINVCERLLLQVLMPNKLRGWIFQKLARTEDKRREILYKEGESLYLGENTEIADALNLLNTRLPANLMPDYHVSLMDKVENPFALRVVDVRKANEIKDTKSVVVLAKKM